jgi:hypothetical protein
MADQDRPQHPIDPQQAHANRLRYLRGRAKFYGVTATEPIELLERVAQLEQACKDGGGGGGSGLAPVDKLASHLAAIRAILSCDFDHGDDVVRRRGLDSAGVEAARRN